MNSKITATANPRISHVALWLCVGGLVSFLSACAQRQLAADAAEPRGNGASEAVPFETGASKPRKYFVGYLPDPKSGVHTAMQMQDVNGMAVVDGDIVLGTVEELSGRNSSKGSWYLKANLWSKGIVPYSIPEGFPNKQAIMAAFDDYHRKTKVRFVPR